MTRTDQVKNILAFLLVLFHDSGEDILQAILEIHPDYLIEKYERYILSNKPSHEWGLHPSIKNKLFNVYFRKWEIDNDK